MKYLFTIILLLTGFCSAYSQAVVREKEEHGKSRLDTNRIVYDENGKELRFYQYSKLINTGEYILTSNGPPGDPNSKSYLKKLSPQDVIKYYKIISPRIAIKSPMLAEGKELDIGPLSDVFTKAELDNKVIVLIFWFADCPPCTEDFTSLNDFFKQIYNPEKLVVLAITADDQLVASAKLKEKPLLYARFLENARTIENTYGLNTFPSYVVADRDHIIRLAVMGSSPITIPAFKSVIRAVLMQ